MQGPVKRELNITFGREYKVINFAANGLWDNNLQRTPVQHLQAAMRRNRELRVMFGQGYWDLACPFGQVRYFLSHAGLPGDRVCEYLYPSGHMPYLGEESALSLAADLRQFIR